jgi:hypothetical protein
MDVETIAVGRVSGPAQVKTELEFVAVGTVQIWTARSLIAWIIR